MASANAASDSRFRASAVALRAMRPLTSDEEVNHESTVRVWSPRNRHHQTVAYSHRRHRARLAQNRHAAD